MFRMLWVCLVLSVFGAGCQFSGADTTAPVVDANGRRVNRIEGTLSIPIPAGLSDARVLDCVEWAIRDTGANKRKIYMVSQWRLEQRDSQSKWILLGLTVRSHYLQLCYRIENGCLVPDVPYSQNLHQNGNRIHRKVPIWINNLRPLILSKFYEAANGRK